MEAYRSIRAEMRDNAASATHPFVAPGREPMQRDYGELAGGEETQERHPFIQPWMEEAFEALTQASETGAPFALLPCTVNGEPTAAIVFASGTDERGSIHVTPLFVAGTPGMVLIDEKGRRAGRQR